MCLHKLVILFSLAGLVSVPSQLYSAQAVSLNGQTHVNHGLVGVGRIPASTRDKFGETFGSFSGFTFDERTWTRNPDGTYCGTLYAQPDRGFGLASATSNYVPRFNKLSVQFVPDASGSTLQNQVELTLADTIKFAEADGTPFTAYDPTPTGAGARPGFPPLPQAYNGRLSLDGEGIVLNADGSFCISDEYGPYVFKFYATGVLLSAIRSPGAFIAKRGGADSFSSNNPPVGQVVPTPANPNAGRQNSQGLEGLSITPDGHTLFTILQSAARQDSGNGGSSLRQNTRLLAYDITTPVPVLKGEYVIVLPVYLEGSAPRVAAACELVAINSKQLLVLTRDSNGHGTAVPASLYRKVVIYDISGATNIAGTPYDSIDTPISPSSVLAAGIVPAASPELVNINDPADLEEFGLTNGPVDGANTLSDKWEAMTLVPALDLAAPDAWFLFIVNDNDFLTSTGFQDGANYDAGMETDSMILVYRLTIPSRLILISFQDEPKRM